jgi:hypothetical protein
MHLLSHCHANGDYFVTNDRSDFINDGKRKYSEETFGVCVRTAEELVAELRSKYGWS